MCFFFLLAIHFLPLWSTCSNFIPGTINNLFLSPSFPSVLFHQVAITSCSQFLFFLVCVCVFRMASTYSKMSLLNIRIVPVVSSNCKSGVLPVENIYCWERRSILWKCVQKAYSLNHLLSIISHVKPNKPKFKKQLKISAT